MDPTTLKPEKSSTGNIIIAVVCESPLYNLFTMEYRCLYYKVALYETQNDVRE